MPGVLDALYKGHVNVAALSRVLERQFMAFDGAEPMDYAIIGDILAYCRDFPGIRHHPIEDHLYIVVRGLNPELAMETAPIVAEHEVLSGLVVEVSVMLNQVLMEIPVPGKPHQKHALGYPCGHTAISTYQTLIFVFFSMQVLLLHRFYRRRRGAAVIHIKSDGEDIAARQTGFPWRIGNPRNQSIRLPGRLDLVRRRGVPKFRHTIRSHAGNLAGSIPSFYEFAPKENRQYPQ